jgi:hypothetical protein
MAGERSNEGKGAETRRVKLQEGVSAPIGKKGMSGKGEQPAKTSPPPAASDSAQSAKPQK